MILNISIKNYRSFKERTDFSLVAESSKSNEQNVFNQLLAQGEDEVRLLNTAMILGSNASGKSNLFRALYEIIIFIGKSKPKAGEMIPAYDPFLFNANSENAPMEFCIEFAGKDNIKYKYEIHFNGKNVLMEELIYWPNKQPTTLFTRLIPQNLQDIKHIGELGSSLKKQNIEVFHNQAILSRFGEDIPNEIISNVYIYITTIEVINACNTRMLSDINLEMRRLFADDPLLFQKMNELIRFVDIGLNGISIREAKDVGLNFPEDMDEDKKKQIYDEYKYVVSGAHPYYDRLNKISKEIFLPFREESHGTQTIFSLGGRLLKAIHEGEVIFVDELDNSLHPFLTRLLVSLFQNKRINNKNAQLVLATHDTNLLDQTIFRKDQIWFTEKDNLGVTELSLLHDFIGVRSDTPFDKWYLAGKFGSIPNIPSFESLFTQVNENS